MNLQDLTLQQLQQIVDGAPEGATHVVDYAGIGKYDYLKNPDTWAAWYGSHWSMPGVLLDLSDKTIIKLSDIRTAIAELEPKQKYDWSNVPDVVNWLATDKQGGFVWGFLEEPVIDLNIKEWVPVAPYTEIFINGSFGTIAAYKGKWKDSLEQRRFKVGDKVSFIRSEEPFQWGAKAKVYEVVDVADNLPTSTDQRVWLDTTASSPHLSRNLCLATAIGQVGIEELSVHSKPVSSEIITNSPEFDGIKTQPDTITVKLDPKKCRIVDPALAYDEPTKRRVGWVGCLGAGAGATGYVPEGNQNDFDAMSEKHRSPACKCHEFPFDAELKVPAGLKHDQGKPRYSLIPSGALASIVDVLEYGATKYAPDGWKHVKNARERYYNASMRHVQAWWSGERLDPETGLPHLAHAVCSLMFLMALKGGQGE